MRHYLLAVFVFLLLRLTLSVPTAFSQEAAPRLDLGIRLLNPASLGLESTASARPSGSSGLSFTLGSQGKTEISLEIVAGPVVVDSQVKLEQFLRENGIRPDTNAQSFVYYLNPDLASVRDIAKGTTLQLPILRTENDRELPRRPIIALVMEPKLKNSLRKNTDSFRLIVKEKKKDFAPEVLDGLNSVDLSLDEFYKDRLTSSHEMLDQVNADVTTLNLIFAKYLRRSRWVFSKGPKLSLTPEDSQQFNSISTDLRDKVEWAKRENPQVQVVARTLKNGNEVQNLIVCYVPEARYKTNQCDQSFSELSSPTNRQSMSVATYLFWATKAGDGVAVSDIRRIPVRWRDGQAMVVDLTIK